MRIKDAKVGAKVSIVVAAKHTRIPLILRDIATMVL